MELQKKDNEEKPQKISEYQDGVLRGEDTPETIRFFGEYVMSVLNGSEEQNK